MTTPRKNDRTTKSHLFQPGNPGRPKGARHKTTVAIEAMMEGKAEAITAKVIELAEKGDLVAAKLVFDRIVPPRKGRAAPFALPAVDTAQGVASAVAQVVAHVAGGSLSPEEGQAVAGLIETARRSLEMVELEARVRAVEEHLSNGKS